MRFILALLVLGGVRPILTSAESRARAQAVEDTVETPAGAPEPASPLTELAVRWEPESPTDGTALAVTLPARPGVEDEKVTAELDDRPVRMGRLGEAWFGLVALATDQSGQVELVVSRSAAGERRLTARRTLTIRPRTYSETELSVAPRFTSPPADVLERIERERELVRSTLRTVTPEWLIDGHFVRPRNTRITSPFGQKRVFNGELQSRHWGVDLGGEVGAPVRVAGRGRIAIARNLYYAGNAVYVDHGLGIFSGYYHLSQIDVSEGDMVERGQVIGKVGATGRVTGPHLHWSFFAGGERLDASSVLDIRVPEAAEIAAPIEAEPHGLDEADVAPPTPETERPPEAEVRDSSVAEFDEPPEPGADERPEPGADEPPEAQAAEPESRARVPAAQS